jgi:hypothetical protein
MTIVVAGSIGRFPVGGHAWVHMHYLLGLRSLGHDVFYVEDCGDESWVYNWETDELTTHLDYPARFVRNCLEPIGFGDRWIYRAGNCSRGLSIDEWRSLLSQADLLIIANRGVEVWRDEMNWPARRAYVDWDPGFTQIHLANGDRRFLEPVERCERLFTIGQRIGAADCRIPSAGRHWIPTRIPCALSHWPVADGHARDFTTIMQWESREPMVHDGVAYGNKNLEFERFLRLPLKTRQTLRVGLTGGCAADMSRYGWEVETGWVASRTPWSYREFIQQSRAEFAVAKQGYVAMRGGWFSDRSIAYLASGRPVLVQDTGQGDWLQTGAGVLLFRDPEEALEGIEAINADYERHCRAARAIAEQYFTAERVLGSLLGDAMN